MSFHCFSCRPLWPCALAIATLGTAAAQTPPRPDPQPTLRAADPASPVPAALYRSLFADLPAGVEQGSDDWKKANAEVGQFRRGHVDLLKWEDAQGTQGRQTATPGAPSSSNPAAPAASKP